MLPGQDSHNFESFPPLEMHQERKRGDYSLGIFHDRTSLNLLYPPINIPILSLLTALSPIMLCVSSFTYYLHPVLLSFLFTIFIKEDILRFKEGNILILPSIIQANEIIVAQLHKSSMLYPLL